MIDRSIDPDQFQAQFGVPTANLEAVETWLHGQGLSTAEVEGSTDYVLATGISGF